MSMVRFIRIGGIMRHWMRGRTNAQSSDLVAATSSRSVKPFNLLRWFSLLSLACVVVLSAALAMVLSRFMTNAMLERDAAISSQFVEGFAHAKPVWSYFVDLQKRPPDPALMSFFDSFFEHFLIQSDVIRANVYAQDQTVIWSSTAELIGTHFGPNDDLEEALRGQLAVELGTVGKDDKAEHVEFEPELKDQRYIETYIPVWSHDRKSVVGVVEIYRLTDELFRAIDAGTRLIWISVLIGGALLYAALFGIARKASVVIEQQERKLVDSESMAAIGEMASAVAHGIRNPLASIRSSAELVMINDLDRARGAAKNIMISVDRLSDWIRGFLYHVHSDGQTLATVDLNTIARSSLAGLAAAMQRQGVNLTLEMEEPLPPVRGDSAVLGHALNSLFVNALEAMPSGGKLHVTTCTDKARRSVELRITDSGGGIAADVANDVFRPFATTKEGGLGLGLTLSRRAIERHGGALDLKGTDGSGSIVTIRMPARY